MKKSLLVLTVLYLSVSHLLAQVPSYVPTDGLVGWWPFNGNANDESGNGNYGTVNGATLTDDRFGNAGSAFSFVNNADTLSEILLNTVPALSNADWTISFWFKTSSTDRQGLITLGSDYVTRDCIQIFIAENLIRYHLHNQVGPYSTEVVDDLWHHAVFINSYGNGLLYLDSSFQDEYLAMNPNISNSGTRRFGGARNGDGNTWRYNGSLDDIAIYNRAVTPEEIIALFAGEPVSPPAACTPLPSNLQQGLVGYWPFCGNANDESGNGNDGTVNGATLTEDRFGNANQAYSFNGVDQFVELTEISLLGISSSSFSVAANFTSTDYGYQSSSEGYIVGVPMWGGGSDEGFKIQTNPLPVASVSASLGIGELVHVTGASFDSQAMSMWHNAVITFDKLSGEFFLYVDGVIVDSNVIVPGELVNPYPISVGAFNGPWLSQFFTGVVDDIAIWNRALTPEEISQLYTGIAPCNLIASETQDTPAEVGGSAQLYVTLNNDAVSTKWQTNAADLGWLDVPDNETYSGGQTQNLLLSNVSLANHEQPFRIIVSNSVCSDTSDVALLLVSNTCTSYDTTYTTIENVVDVFDTTTVINTIEVFDTLTVYNTIDVFDTTEFVVEVFDTLTNVMDVFDTTTVFLQVDIYDTLFIDVYDTTYVVNTVDIYDTTFVTVTDTTYLQVVDTSYVTVTDTLIIDVPSGVDGTILNTLLLYPNPTSDQLIISYGNFAAMAGYSLSIFNNGGSAVYEDTDISQAQETLDISQWSAGVYQVVVYNTGGVPVETRQIVIQ
jgi:Concanavalin A-like lectin/glucanases superfamily/Secretion system C-terminal sorting domain